ncbi:hypothetical protein GCM10010517_30600 [Streptosporangium fragile]|uniref:Uncharacterized protein n=1 Tax=Streptosporangium fragile TaxID=46186 RepID=A0ABN3VWL3_9ACTN
MLGTEHGDPCPAFGEKLADTRGVRVILEVVRENEDVGGGQRDSFVAGSGMPGAGAPAGRGSPTGYGSPGRAWKSRPGAPAPVGGLRRSR